MPYLEEKYDVNLRKYKIVEENGINILVLKTSDSDRAISSFKYVLIFKSIKILLTSSRLLISKSLLTFSYVFAYNIISS